MAVVQWFFLWNVLKLQRLWGDAGLGEDGRYLGLNMLKLQSFESKEAKNQLVTGVVADVVETPTM